MESDEDSEEVDNDSVPEDEVEEPETDVEGSLDEDSVTELLV